MKKAKKSQPPGAPADRELGKLSEALRDTRREPESPGSGQLSFEGSIRLAEQPADTGLPARKPRRKPAEPAGDDRPILPRGALVIMRRSGGLRFSSREIAVYRDGRVTYWRSEVGAPGEARTVRQLTEGQVAKLRGALEKIDFARKRFAAGRQNPDAFAYEIAARVGRATHFVEAFEGSIPRALTPLIRQLGRLMAAED
jgi:hypothetical protein